MLGHYRYKIFYCSYLCMQVIGKKKFVGFLAIIGNGRLFQQLARSSRRDVEATQVAKDELGREPSSGSCVCNGWTR